MAAAGIINARDVISHRRIVRGKTWRPGRGIARGGAWRQTLCGEKWRRAVATAAWRHHRVKYECGNKHIAGVGVKKSGRSGIIILSLSANIGRWWRAGAHRGVGGGGSIARQKGKTCYLPLLAGKNVKIKAYDSWHANGRSMALS
jgi:hypothetical protein